MTRPEKQLEASLSKKDGFNCFLSSGAVDVPQECSAKFEPTLRRIAFQAMIQKDIESISMVLRVSRHLCEQNERKGIHVLLSAGLPDVLGKIFHFIFKNTAAVRSMSDQTLTALRIFVETVVVIVPLINDHCVWFKTMMTHLLSLLHACYLHLTINNQIVDGINQVLSILSRDSIYAIREVLSGSPQSLTVCKAFVMNLSKLGDFQMQSAVIELLVRLLPNSVRQRKAAEWNRNDYVLTKLFSEISYTEFEKSVRAYLNAVNKLRNGVMSVPYMQIVIGSATYSGGEHSWIDFCHGTKRISFSFPLTGDEFSQAYEALSETDVKSYDIQVNNELMIIKIETKQPLNEIFDDDVVKDNASSLTITLQQSQALAINRIKLMFKQYLEPQQQNSQSSRPFVSRPAYNFLSSQSSFDKVKNKPAQDVRNEASKPPSKSQTDVKSGTAHNVSMQSVNSPASQNVVETSQPSFILKESRSSTALPLDVSCRQRALSKSRGQQNKRLELIRVDIKRSQRVPPQAINESMISNNLNLNKSIATPLSRPKVSIPAQALRYKVPQEIIPETQANMSVDDRNTSVDLRLSQLHWQHRESSHSSPAKQVVQVDVHHGPIEDSNQNTVTSRDNRSHGNNLAESTSKTRCFRQNVAKQTERKKVEQRNAKIDSDDYSKVPVSTSADEIMLQAKENNHHTVCLTDITQPTASTASKKATRRPSTARMTARSSRTKIPKANIEKVSDESESAGRNSDTKCKSRIADEVNAEFKNLRDTLTTKEAPQTESSARVDMNASTAPSPRDVISTARRDETKSKRSRTRSAGEDVFDHAVLRGADTNRDRMRQAIENDQSKSSDVTASSRTSHIAKRTRSKVKNVTAEDVAKQIIEEEPEQLSDASPEKARRDKVSTIDQPVLDFLHSSDVIEPDVSAEDSSNLKMPRSANKSEQNVSSANKSLISGLSDKRVLTSLTTIGDVADASQKRASSKRSKVSFESSNMKENDETRTSCSTRKRRQRSKKEKLFDSSGFSSAASTCSDVSWVQAHKKKLKKKQVVDWVDEDKSKPVRTYSRKRVQSGVAKPPMLPLEESPTKTTIEEFVESTNHTASSPEIAREDTSNSCVLEPLKFDFSMGNELSRSFAEIIEEETERIEAEEKAETASKPTSSTPHRKNSTSPVPGYLNTIETPAAVRDMRSPVNVPPFIAYVPNSQCSHISSIKTPTLSKFKVSSSKSSLSLDVSANESTKCDDLNQMIEQQTLFAITDDFNDDQDDPSILRALSSGKNKNSRTPDDPALCKSGIVANPSRKMKQSKRSSDSSELVTGDETNQRKQRRRAPKKLNFSRASTRVSSSSHSHPSSSDAKGARYENIEALEDMSDSTKNLPSDSGSVRSGRRDRTELPVRRLCRRMSANVQQVKKLWKDFNVQRDHDHERFKRKFSRLAKRQASTVKRLGLLEGAAHRCMTALHHQFKLLLDNSIDTLANVRRTHQDMSETQSKSEVDFQRMMEQLTQRVTVDLTRITQRVKK